MVKHTILSSQFKENPDKWGRELSEKIELELKLLIPHLEGIKEANIDLEGDQNFAGIPRLEHATPDERRGFLKRTTVHNAFLSMFRHVVVYIDKILSMHFYSKETQENPVPVDSIDDFEEFFNTLPIEKYKEFSQGRMSFPAKVEAFPGLNERTKERLIAYNKIRNSFEHHGGIAKAEIILLISTFDIEQEDSETGIAKVTLKLDVPTTKIFAKDEEVILKAQDVTLIGHDIIGWVIKDILLALKEE